MVKRSLSPEMSESFFLFGARGTGKSTWLREQFHRDNILWIDLLDPNDEDIYLRKPKQLELEILQMKKKGLKPQWVIIDEVQKAPKLLDVVHRLIEYHKIRFALTGSSSRKLKRGHANLLGGRAELYTLHPFTHIELRNAFDLDQTLAWGTLPKVFFAKNAQTKLRRLRSYCQIYLKEEILIEQLVRNLVPFKGFLEISAQMNGERLNYEKIARDIGVDNKTVQSYFEILEDTYLGFRLPAFHTSIRKGQLLASKYYWFDIGVQRFLAGFSHSTLVRGSSDYGRAFETFLINELYRHNAYHELDFKMSYFQTKHGSEIDLILSRGRESIAIEIKSAVQIDHIAVRALELIATDIPGCKKMYYLSQDPKPQLIGKVQCLPWTDIFSILPSL